MSIELRILSSNTLMALGLAPYALTLGYLCRGLGAHGEAALGEVFLLIAGFGVSYLAALAIAWPAAIWSGALANASGRHTRLAAVLRWLSMAGVFPLFALFPVLLFGLRG